MTPATVVLVIRAEPHPSGSKRGYIVRKKDGTSHVNIVDARPKGVISWRQAVIDEGHRAMTGRPPLDGPLRVAVTFSLLRPKHHYGTGRNANAIKASSPRFPEGPPDISKLLRGTEDALTAARVWRDDARVVEYTRAAKVYADPWAVHGTVTLDRVDGSILAGIDDADVLPVPGAVIRITALTVQTNAEQLTLAGTTGDRLG